MPYYFSWVFNPYNLSIPQRTRFVLRVQYSTPGGIAFLCAYNSSDRVVCSNFEHPALTWTLYVYALCICCRHDTKKKLYSKTETISKLTVHSQMFYIYFVMDEVWSECPKLGHTTLSILNNLTMQGRLLQKKKYLFAVTFPNPVSTSRRIFCLNHSWTK